MEKDKKDGLTGLTTRETFSKYGEELNNRIKTGDSSHKEFFTLAFMDLDNFKFINERYGHSFGDKLLTETAGIIVQQTGDSCLAGRFGGDEFVFLFERLPFEEAFVIMENIRQTLKNKELIYKGADNFEEKIRSTCSVGMASYPRDGRDFQEVFRSADEALYRAKTEGRDRICIAIEEKKVAKTVYYTRRQIQRISALSKQLNRTESELYREAVDLLLKQYQD